jgi:hypothetical protein
MKSGITAFVGGLVLLTMAEAQTGSANNRCVNLAAPYSRIAVEGRLTRQLFPGPPNYESVEEGDSEESVFILVLRHPICIDDNGEFADPSEQVTTVHVSSRDPSNMALLTASVGREVAVSGEGFPAYTGRHHAPLVILADSIAVRP